MNGVCNIRDNYCKNIIKKSNRNGVHIRYTQFHKLKEINNIMRRIGGESNTIGSIKISLIIF